LQPAIRNFALLFVATLLFHVAGSWTMPLVDRDEPRFAEASREMLQRGDYVVPYLNNRYRFDKPPLTYWAQSASYRIFGDNDFAARFPSAIAAALTALVIFAWGRRIASERLGWWAAIIFTLCLQTFIHGKAAVADMWMVLFVTAAHWAGYELLRDRFQPQPDETVKLAKRWWWAFYLSLAIAFLAKGPIGWTPLLTIAAARLFLPDVKLNRRFLFFTGALFVLSVVAVWGIPALVRTNGEFFNIGIGRHVVARSVVAMEGHGASTLWTYFATLPFYFVLVFVTFAPWSIKLPWLTRKLWRERDALDNYLIAGTAMIFIIFTLVKTKLPHYTLPAFPLLALLLAKALLQAPNADRFLRRTTIFAAAAAFLFVFATPIAARYSPAVQLVQKARGDLTREMEFGSTTFREPSLVWYFRKHVDGFQTDLTEEAVQPFLEKPGARFVVVPTEAAIRLYPSLPAGWKSYTAQGINTANGKRVDLTLILKPS
jgi:4-amino-4-deoxy-L-arabinose transferase-like glycosyltransferase